MKRKLIYTKKNINWFHKKFKKAFEMFESDFRENGEQINRFLDIADLEIKLGYDIDNQEEISYGLYYKDKFISNLVFEYTEEGKISATIDPEVQKRINDYNLPVTFQYTLDGQERRLLISDNHGRENEFVFDLNSNKKDSITIISDNPQEEFSRLTISMNSEECKLSLEKNPDEITSAPHAERSITFYKKSKRLGVLSYYNENCPDNGFFNISLVNCINIKDSFLIIKYDDPCIFTSKEDVIFLTPENAEETLIQFQYAKRVRETFSKALHMALTSIQNFDGIIEFKEASILKDAVIVKRKMEEKLEKKDTTIVDVVPDLKVIQCDFERKKIKEK